MKDKMRDEYDAWYAKEIGVLGTPQHKSWLRPWIASREVIKVELPELHTIAPDDDKKWHGCRNSTIRTCARAVENAGLKVKIS